MAYMQIDSMQYQWVSDMKKFFSKVKDDEDPFGAGETQRKLKKILIICAIIVVIIVVFLSILLPIVLSDRASNSIVDSKYNVEILSDNNIFDDTTALFVDCITDESHLKLFVEKIKDVEDVDLGNVVIYDIECNAEIDGTVTIRVPYPKSNSGSIVKVYYTSDDKAYITEHGCIYDDGIVEFKTTHLSYYVIGEVVKQQTPSDDNTGNNSEQKPNDNVGSGTTPNPDDNQSGNTDPNPDSECPTPSRIIVQSNGGTGKLANQSVTVGVQTMLNECSLTKDGYTFGGWATTASGSASYTDGATFTATAEASTTLYAVWVPNSNSIIFNANGGSGFMDSISVETGKSVNLPANAFSKTGYTFMGWSDVQGSTVKYTDRQFITMTSSATITLYAVWGANDNALVLKANNGTSAETTIHIKTGESKNLPANTFAKSGYTFIGWSTSSGGSVEYTDGASYTMGESSATLYAIWEANTNTVTFNANGGIGTMSAQQIKTDAKANLNANTFTREGYTFAGWATTSTGNAVYADTASYTMGKESNYTLYAVWIKAAYTITYHMNNGSNSISNPVGYDINSETITFADPTRDGYTFLGWYTDAAFQNKITSIPKGSTGNKEVYASWSANTNSINFNSNGGNGSMSAQQAKTDEKVTLKSNSFTRDGYTFAGWATTSGGTVVYADQANYTVGTASSVTLYAVWTPINYTITYDLQGGSISGNKTSYNATMNSFTLPTPTKTGYSFEGWSGTGISGTQKDVTISKGSYGDRSYTANWKADEYTITLNANGGQVSPGTLIVTYNGDVEYPTPTRTGYTFGGWFNGNNEYTDGKWTYTNGITLTAKWNPNANTKYTINHYQQNADNNEYTLKDTETLYGTTATAVIPATKNYTGFRAPTAQTITILADGTAVVDYYYARETFTVTFVTNGGDAIDAIDCRYGNTFSTSTAIRDGYTFGGWFTDISLTTPYSQEIISSNTMLYAWWMEETKPVEFTFSGTNSKTITDFVGNSTQVVIPSYIGGHPVECISSVAFNDKHSIISIVVPNTVTYIGMASFKGCSSLECMTLPFVGGSVKTTQDVGQYPFGYIFGKEYYDGSISASQVYYSNPANGTWATFYVPASLKNVTINGGYILRGAFDDCRNITEIIINNNTNIIGSCAFSDCKSLVSITLPNTVERIEEDAFHSCSSLKNICIPESVSYIGESAFYGCKLEEIHITNIKAWCEIEMHTDSCTLSDAKLLLNNSLVSDLADYSEISRISNCVFKGYEYFENLTIPDNVIYIGNAAFCYCTNLSSVTLSRNIDAIGSSAFYSTKLTSIFIPKNIKTIGANAFEYSKIETIVFEEGSQLSNIGSYAFSSNNLLSLRIPESVLSIEEKAFAYNKNLTTIECYVASKPDGWSEFWNYNDSEENCYEVKWFCAGDTWDGTISYSFAGGSGTEGDPYLISNAEQLAYVAASVNQGVDTFSGKYLKLTQDLHLMNKEWSPIGNTTYQFQGNFDGSNYTIYGLKISNEEITYSGLFGNINDGIIKDLIVLEVDIQTSKGYAGIICGYSNHSNSETIVFENCHVQGNVKCSLGSHVGGIVGRCNASIDRCSADVTTYSAVPEGSRTNNYAYVGGIAGSSNSITNCVSSGTMKTASADLYKDNSYVGGIVGSGKVISNCYSTATIIAISYKSSYCGGIAGKADEILNSFATGNLQAKAYSSSDAYVGRILGEVDETDIVENCYADSTQTCTQSSERYDTEATTNSLGTLQFTQTLQSENFIYNTLGWSSDVWQINEGGFPTLK